MDIDKCKERVADPWGWNRSHQCTRKIWKDGYCKQHHPDTVKEREIKKEERYRQEFEKSVYGQLRKAHERIKELEEEIKQLRGQDAQK